MSHPRAVYPPSIATHYRQHGGRATASAYRTSWTSLRRWLIEHGVKIRPHGLRIGQRLRHSRGGSATTGVVGLSTVPHPSIQQTA